MEYENKYENHYASKALGGTALGIAIGSGVLGLANGGLGNIFSGTGNGNGNGKCSEDHYINRYEAALSARINELVTQNKLLESNIYTDSKIADVYERLNTKISCIEGQLAQQAVYNATNTATLNCISGQVAQLMALTKVVVPASSICPEVMPRYNSFVTPTTTTTGA